MDKVLVIDGENLLHRSFHAAERAGQSLEDYQVCIEANWRNNDYDLLEQVRVRTGRYGVTLQLLEEDDLEYYSESDLRVDEINL